MQRMVLAGMDIILKVQAVQLRLHQIGYLGSQQP